MYHILVNWYWFKKTYKLIKRKEKKEKKPQA